MERYRRQTNKENNDSNVDKMSALQGHSSRLLGRKERYSEHVSNMNDVAETAYFKNLSSAANELKVSA